jgi:hypothetical protein
LAVRRTTDRSNSSYVEFPTNGGFPPLEPALRLQNPALVGISQSALGR